MEAAKKRMSGDTLREAGSDEVKELRNENDELKNICNIEHTRHRAPKGFLINIISALTAYHFLPKKPSLNITRETEQSKQLLIAA
jgi:hypothetical protein